ncbi:ribonuclease H-like domain-containing protein, partial [Tanacetum coccineum]
DHEIFDSRCSRHMTGNKSFLIDYQEINGGFGAFGGSLKGGKNTGKGKIRTGKLDFKDVYFVKELKFNLFSVLQMCDKKNNVLFTKTECLVLSPDFKLLDESQDETSGILQTFITGIENQINHKVKIIRCDNGTEFKNNDMNQFCGMKGIKREFSVARTPQQNGVAERKNRTLIEAARTMLADSLLPTTFWAEVVSTACYVQNRVLVTKPHNKTPYELLHGRPPSISFMRPFGCPLTTGNQTNKNAGIKDNTQQYILLPLLYDSIQSSKDVVADDAGKKTNEEPTNEAYANSTNRVSTVSPSTSDVGQSFINADDLPTDPLMPDLEDTTDLLNIGIFSGAYDDEDVGVEVDLNNLETTMNVSHIPITRIYKDHPKDQVIRDINPATQTRRMQDF